LRNMDIKLFEKLLEEEKPQEAIALLKVYLQQPLTDEEKGGLYIAFATAYMKIKTQANKDYLAELKEIASTLKDVQKAEQQVDDAINLDQIRRELK
jgi:hypothetical protein